VLLEDAHFSVVGEAATGEKSLSEIKKKKPQALLIDILLSDIRELSIMRQLLSGCPDMKIIILAGMVYDNFPRSFLEVKAHAYISKKTSSQKLVDTIGRVFKGETVVEPHMPVSSRSAKYEAQGSCFDVLSNREREIVPLLVKGNNITEIAEKLDISPKTISTYRVSLLQKLRIKNEVALLLLVLQEGWCDKK